MEFFLPIENKDKLIEYCNHPVNSYYYQITTFTKGIFTNVPQYINDIKYEWEIIYKGTYADFIFKDFNKRISAKMKEKIRDQLTDFYINKTFDRYKSFVPDEWNIKNITEENNITEEKNKINNIIKIETYLLKKKYDILYIDPKFYKSGCLDYHLHPLTFIGEFGDKEAYLKDEICYIYIVDSVLDRNNLEENITNFVKSL